MHDIFISYSRKDSEQALALAERLRAAGLDIWIDQVGIEAATSWSSEIVQAIEGSTVMMILLSADSMKSDNVIREVSIAFEKKKRILPVALNRDYVIPHELQYQLAGIQRAKIADFEGILRGLAKLGIRKLALPNEEAGKREEQGEYAHQGQPPPNPRLEKAGALDTRKSLMVLPFEDLSPTHDNEWFADGIMSELIGALSRIKSLRLIDQKTSREFKNVSIKTAEIAQELDVRYFIEGSVRKFGDQIKIMLQLLDIEHGEYLWQDSHKGVFADIFEIQEDVAKKVVEGLTLTLSADEKKHLHGAKGTDNAEAYELYLKAKEYQRPGSKAGLENGAALMSAAIELDPNFAEAYNNKANCLALLYRSYNHTITLLDDAETLVRRALELKPSLLQSYGTLSRLRLFRGDVEGAVSFANEYVRKDSANPDAHSLLGYIYAESLQFDRAIEPLEATLRLDDSSVRAYFNLCQCCDKANELEKLRYWSNAGLPKYERLLRMRPDDERAKSDYAVLLHWSGQDERAIAYLETLTDIRDAMTEFNIGCLWAQIHIYPPAIGALRRAFEKGFERYDLFRMFDSPIAELPEFKSLLADIEAKEAKQPTPTVADDQASDHG